MSRDSGNDAYERVGEIVSIFQRGRKWYANYQHDGRQVRKALRTTSKKEARRRAIQLEADLAAGRYRPATQPASITDTVAAYEAYLGAERRSAKTKQKYKKVLQRTADLASKRKTESMAGLDRKFLDAYRAQRVADGVAPKTLYTECVIIRQLVLFALSRDMLTVDPLKGIKLKKPKPTPQPCWTYDQVQLILENSEPAVKAAFTLLAETGMRFGEVAWLTWDDIDLVNNVIHIRGKDGWTPKTGDQRSIPMSRKAREVLAALPRRCRWVVTAAPSRKHAEGNRQVSERRLLAALKRILEKLKLPGKLHTFRHFFVSNALLQSTPEATVRKWVGHIDENILKLYTHIHDAASQAAMQRLARANQAGSDSDGKETKPANVTDNGSANHTAEQRKAESDSAQSQHKRKEHDHGKDAK